MDVNSRLGKETPHDPEANTEVDDWRRQAKNEIKIQPASLLKSSWRTNIGAPIVTKMVQKRGRSGYSVLLESPRYN